MNIPAITQMAQIAAIAGIIFVCPPAEALEQKKAPAIEQKKLPSIDQKKKPTVEQQKMDMIVASIMERKDVQAAALEISMGKVNAPGKSIVVETPEGKTALLLPQHGNTILQVRKIQVTFSRISEDKITLTVNIIDPANSWVGYSEGKIKR